MRKLFKVKKYSRNKRKYSMYLISNPYFSTVIRRHLRLRNKYTLFLEKPKFVKYAYTCLRKWSNWTRCIFFFFQLLFSIASAQKAQYSIRVTKSTQKNARTVTQCLTTAPANDCKYLPATYFQNLKNKLKFCSRALFRAQSLFLTKNDLFYVIDQS